MIDKKNKFILKLYVTGNTTRAKRAIANLKNICETYLVDNYEIYITDILEKPQVAEKEKILATPTLIKEYPPPLRRIIGDLSNEEKVKSYLDIELYLSDNK